ncbi:MAG: acyltransferase [Candidatus Manganitrophus sp. SB1]|nr:acyltransferase [Candidatus Manganitrophus morganii]
MLSQVILKIKRKENSFYSFLYDLGKFVLSFNVPSIKPIHLPLYHLDHLVKEGLRWFISVFWAVPLFRARCEKVGRNLRLPNGIPYIVGGHLKIFLGDNVSIGRSTIGASKVFDEPVLKIGNNSSLGYGTTISVAKEVIIGDNCMIAPGCIIMDSDDHPIDPQKRLLGMPVEKEEVRPVKIGNNVWIGAHCIILKGVTIGDNSIISAHAVITRDVMENSIYAGNPARPVSRDIGKLSDQPTIHREIESPKS